MSNKPYQPQQDIAELMKLYQQDVLETPTIPSREVLLLRARLIFEEAMEFVEAAGCYLCFTGNTLDPEIRIKQEIEPNLVGMADAIGDTLVVTYGAANAIGVQVQPVWDDIQRSNMSKTWAHCSMCDADLLPVGGCGPRIMHPYPVEHPQPWTIVHKIHKREDGKVLKSTDYSPADIAAVLAAQTAAS